MISINDLPVAIGKTEPSVLIPAHRIHAENYLADALGRKSRVLWITIMSQHTTKWLRTMFEAERVQAEEIRVLTLAPTVSEEVMRAFALHLNEPASDVITQVREAWRTWCDFSEEYPQLTVRAYSSSPTFQGVMVDGQEAMIELISFHTPPKERVGLFLSKHHEPESFTTVSNACENLWRTADER